MRDATKLNRNVIMIGMPACGKSTVGKNLAHKMGMEFADGDDIIRETMNQTLEAIIDERGPFGFLELEEEILLGVQLDGVVFAPGGSIAYEDKALKHLGEQGTIVYLQAPYADIERRVGDLRNRGVVMKDGIGMSLQALFDERNPLYEAYADVTVNEEGLSVYETTEAVYAALMKFWGMEQ